jgi:hypothetical protein
MDLDKCIVHVSTTKYYAELFDYPKSISYASLVNYSLSAIEFLATMDHFIVCAVLPL